MAHIRETGSQFFNIGPDQRIGCKAGYVIGKQHQIPGVKGSIYAAGGVGQEKKFRAQQLHQPDRQHHIADRVPFVIMYPALHAHHRHIAHISENKPAVMSRYGGYGKTFNIPVGYLGRHPDRIRIVAQTGA